MVEARHAWTGVSLDTLLDGVETAADYVLAFCDGGYTTNMPLEDLTGGQAWIAYEYDGEPLEPEHGGPARLLVPHLYFWKSAKWVRGLELIADDVARLLGAVRLPQLRGPMERTAVRRRLNWQIGTVEGLVTETPRTRSIVLDVPGWPGHRAGQHVDVRLTAEDGYQAQRSYSIASAPEDDQLVLTVERLDDGEVSPYLVDELRTGDELELRGPIGGYFVWEARAAAARCSSSPAAPGWCRSARCCATIAPAAAPCRCGCCTRPARLPDVIYRDELMRIAGNGEIDIRFTLTREQPEGWRGYRRRIDQELLAEVAWPPTERPLVYVCGPTDFVETAASALVALGHEPGRIRLERFGGTGGSA